MSSEKAQTKRAIQAQETRKKIYEVAMQLFYEEGIDNVNVSEICEAAGVSKGLFYNSFPSKESVFVEHANKNASFQEGCKKQFVDGQTFDERISIFVECNIDPIYNKLHQNATRTAYISALKSPGETFYCSKEREYYITLQEVVEYGQDRGEIDPSIDSEEITDMYIRAMWGNYFGTLIGFSSIESILQNAQISFKAISDYYRVKN